MNRAAHFILLTLGTVLVVPRGMAYGADYQIDWFTIDGGGQMTSSGGGFDLSATNGQPDAGVMSGGDFELVGGFWALKARLVLVSTEPPADGSLPKTQNNLILCAFDASITLPALGNPLVIKDMTNGCVDVSANFIYSIDADDPNGCTLQATENLIQLTDGHWYQVSSAPGWTVVEPFHLEVYTLAGDANNSGRVTTADYSDVKAALGGRGDLREDLNGSGRVTTADYSVVKATLGDRAPTKPALCP